MVVCQSGAGNGGVDKSQSGALAAYTGCMNELVALLQATLTLLTLVSSGNVDGALRDQALALAEQTLAQAAPVQGTADTGTTEAAVPIEPISISDVQVIPGATTTQIRWHTSDATASKIIFKDSKGVAREKASQLGEGTFHVVDIDTLTPSTLYSFDIIAGSGKSSQALSGTATTLSQ